MYVSVSICLYVDLKAGAEYVQEKVVEFSGSEDTGICDLPETSARNQMWVVCKERMGPFTSGITLQPQTSVI